MAKIQGMGSSTSLKWKMVHQDDDPDDERSPKRQASDVSQRARIECQGQHFQVNVEMLVLRSGYFSACFRGSFEEGRSRVVRWPEECPENANAVAQWSHGRPIPGLGMLEGEEQWRRFLKLERMADMRCLDAFLKDMCRQQCEKISTDWYEMDRGEVMTIIDAVRRFRRCPATVTFQTKVFEHFLKDDNQAWKNGAFGSLLLYTPLYQMGPGDIIEEVQCHKHCLQAYFSPKQHTARALLYTHYTRSLYPPTLFEGDEESQEYWNYLADLWIDTTTQILDLEEMAQIILNGIAEVELDIIDEWKTIVLILRIVDRRVPDTGHHKRFHDAVLTRITKDCKGVITSELLMTSPDISERIRHRFLNHYILHR